MRAQKNPVSKRFAPESAAESAHKSAHELTPEIAAELPPALSSESAAATIAVSRSSQVFAPSAAKQYARWLTPVIFGIALAFAHRYLDLSIGLPGHFGLIWMAGLMGARLSSPLAGAATCTVFVYAFGNMGLHWTPMHALTHTPQYLAAALVVDALWPFARHLMADLRRTSVRTIAVIFGLAGLAYMLKPVTNLWVGQLFGLSAKSLAHGLAFPMTSHFFFGATGAVLGLLVWQAVRGRAGES